MSGQIGWDRGTGAAINFIVGYIPSIVNYALNDGIVHDMKRRKMKEIKEAIVYKDQSGYWVAEDTQTNQKISHFVDSELKAYKIANGKGYVVR